jgi:hypothetical protein
VRGVAFASSRLHDYFFKQLNQALSDTQSRREQVGERPGRPAPPPGDRYSIGGMSPAPPAGMPPALVREYP